MTSRQIGDRLRREAMSNISIKIERTDKQDIFAVAGRGELQLAVLIETMRREGYEFAVSRPEIIVREIDGVKCEPVEEVVIDVPETGSRFGHGEARAAQGAHDLDGARRRSGPHATSSCRAAVSSAIAASS